MHVLPNTHDTIVAVSSAWAPSLVGVLRLSGPDAFRCIAGIVAAAIPDQRRGTCCVRVDIAPESSVPGDLFWFRAPHSYTAQDVIELHVPGSPPLLRILAGKLIEHGARRALPGEFTARAFMAGKLDAAGVERVSGLVAAESAAQARAAARGDRTGQRERLDQVRRQLLELRARIEAGIDFVDEEDIRFITPNEVVAQLDQLLATLTALNQTTPDWRSDRQHVALAGLPNAGKSTLFNALVGHERAVVSPVLGTTRDVLAAELQCGALRVVLQDCAGLGHTPNELELAAHVAAEQAADAADLVLWVHAADEPWTADERAALARLDRERCLIVISKIDQMTRTEPSLDMQSDFEVAAPTGRGLDALREGIAVALDRTTALQPSLLEAELLERLQRAHALAAAGDPEVLDDAELICFELRWVDERLGQETFSGRTEDVLGWIFSQFCMGK